MPRILENNSAWGVIGFPCIVYGGLGIFISGLAIKVFWEMGDSPVGIVFGAALAVSGLMFIGSMAPLAHSALTRSHMRLVPGEIVSIRPRAASIYVVADLPLPLLAPAAEEYVIRLRIVNRRLGVLDTEMIGHDTDTHRTYWVRRCQVQPNDISKVEIVVEGPSELPDFEAWVLA